MVSTSRNRRLNRGATHRRTKSEAPRREKAIGRPGVRLTTSDKKFLHQRNDIARGGRERRRAGERIDRERKRQVSSNGSARGILQNATPFFHPTLTRAQHPLRRVLVSLSISFLPFPPDLPPSRPRRARESFSKPSTRRLAQSGEALKRGAGIGRRVAASSVVVVAGKRGRASAEGSRTKGGCGQRTRERRRDAARRG